jgi:hypothetical protein
MIEAVFSRHFAFLPHVRYHQKDSGFSIQQSMICKHFQNNVLLHNILSLSQTTANPWNAWDHVGDSCCEVKQIPHR